MAATDTLPTKSLAPLAPFAHEWVGGDIHGLANFAATLYGYIPKYEDVITALNKKVSQIVGDAGWGIGGNHPLFRNSILLGHFGVLH